MTRFGYVMVTYFSVMGVAIAAFIPTPLRLVWNASASVPIGLYDLDPPRDLAVGDLVGVMPDKPLADWMVERGYIGRGVPLMKRVMGLPGQQVCRMGNAVTVDAMPLGDALDRDRRGRKLPVWQGCRRITDGNIFLMNPTCSIAWTVATSVRSPRARSSARRRRSTPMRPVTVATSGAPLRADRSPIGGSGARRWLFNLTAKETVMPQIGEFTRDETGFIGHLATLLLDQDIIIVLAEPSDAENAPDYRVHLFDGMNNETGPEIGAAWKRTRREGRRIHRAADRRSGIPAPGPRQPVP